MKKKLVSVLLALTLCGSLAIPAFAEPTEEIECVGLSRCPIEFSDSAWARVETEVGVMAITHGELMHGSRLAERSMGYICDKCGKDNWGPPTEKEHKFRNTGNPDTHEEYYTVIYLCKTADCPGGFADDYTIWTSHSMSKYDFGSNYHKGKLHYVEWIWRCSDCGYTESRWESQSCPGNENGEGCIFGVNKVDPPVEVQDVTQPEKTGILEEINMSTVMRLLADSKDDNAMNTRAADHDCTLLVRRVISTGYTVNGNQHQKYNLCEVYCKDECGVEGELKIPEGGWENHSFTTLVSGIPLNCCSGSSHQVGYEFQCVCGAKEIQKDSVSMKKTDFGSNYHRGALHYIEWIWRCPICGYTESRWESQSCPGNDNGEGCIFGVNKVEPPVEVQDVTGPEEVQSGEGTEPEEVTTPEATTEPEEAILPEETATPEEVTEPEEIAEPEETILPEETT